MAGWPTGSAAGGARDVRVFRGCGRGAPTARTHRAHTWRSADLLSLSLSPPLSVARRCSLTRHTSPCTQPCPQAFAAPERVAELVGRVKEALAGPLPAGVAKMKLYLTNPSTHAILFKPIKSNVAEAHGQVRAQGRAARTLLCPCNARGLARRCACLGCDVRLRGSSS